MASTAQPAGVQAVPVRVRRLALVALAWGGVCLGAFNLYVGATYLSQYRYRNDFRLVFAAARSVRALGWPHLYDYQAQRLAVAALGRGFNWQPFISPPPLVAIATPFSLLPFQAGLALWTLCLAGALVGAWYLAAPGGAAERLALLALLLGFFPAVFGVAVGQPVALVALAVAMAWWLEARGHPCWAGLALGAIALKPQLGILVPVALVFGLRLRMAAVWLAVSAAVGVASLLAIGGEGLRGWQEGLSAGLAWSLTRQLSASGLIGVGPAFLAFQVLVGGLVAAVSRHLRRRETGLLLAAGLVGSSLFSPYLSLQDLAMLILAGWLVLHSRPPLWQLAIMLLGYLILYGALSVGTLPVVLWRLAWLASLLAPDGGPTALPGGVWSQRERGKGAGPGIRVGSAGGRRPTSPR